MSFFWQRKTGATPPGDEADPPTLVLKEDDVREVSLEEEWNREFAVQDGAPAALAVIEPDEAGSEGETAFGSSIPPKQPITPLERAERRKRMRRVLPALLATLLYFFLAMAMFNNALRAAKDGVSVSLRYVEPLAPAQVSHAQYVMADPDVTAEFSAIYWYESRSETLETDRGSQKAQVLFVDGDMSSVLRVDFIGGTYPAPLESRGVALSEALAWALYGGDAVGAELEWNGEIYTVRGVFAGDDLLLLAQVSAADTQIPGFTGVELLGQPEDDPREAAANYATQAGLQEPDVIISVGMVPGIIAAMAWLPAIILILWFAVRLLRSLRHVTYWKRQLTWFALLIAAAILLPKALELLPSWMIPTMWSDFEHWSDIFKEMRTRVTDWLSLSPYLGDVRLKEQLILQAVLLVPTLFAMVSVIRRWEEHLRRLDGQLAAAAGEVATLPAVVGQDKNEEKTKEEKQMPEEEMDDILMLKAEKDVKKRPIS